MRSPCGFTTVENVPDLRNLVACDEQFAIRRNGRAACGSHAIVAPIRTCSWRARQRLPGAFQPESERGRGGVNRYFPARIKSRRPREQPRLATEFVCASERRRSRGGDWYAPAARARRGRSWANPWPTGGWGSRAGRTAFPRRPHVWLSCPHVAKSSRNAGRTPCLFPVSRPMCVIREREQRTPRTRRRPPT